MCPTGLTIAVVTDTINSMMNVFEARLSVVKHIASMMVEMADVDFDKLTKEEEQNMFEDYEEVGTHLLDSLQFEVTEVAENGEMTIKMLPIDPVQYIEKYLEENPES